MENVEGFFKELDSIIENKYEDEKAYYCIAKKRRTIPILGASYARSEMEMRKKYAAFMNSYDPVVKEKIEEWFSELESSSCSRDRKSTILNALLPGAVNYMPWAFPRLLANKDLNEVRKKIDALYPGLNYAKDIIFNALSAYYFDSNHIAPRIVIVEKKHEMTELVKLICKSVGLSSFSVGLKQDVESLVGGGEVYSNSSLPYIYNELSRRVAPAPIIMGLDTCSKAAFSIGSKLLEGKLDTEVLGQVSMNSPMFFIVSSAGRLRGHSCTVVPYEQFTEGEFLKHIIIQAKKRGLSLTKDAAKRLNAICDNDLSLLNCYLGELKGKYDATEEPVSEDALMKTLDIFKRMDSYKANYVSDFNSAIEKAFSCGCVFNDRVRELLSDINNTDEENTDKMKLLRNQSTILSNALPAKPMRILKESDFDSINDMYIRKTLIRDLTDAINSALPVSLISPPGCGKTSLVNAIAKMMNVPFIYIDATTLSNIDILIGSVNGTKMTESIVSKIFKRNTSGRCILFFDEIDKCPSKEVLNVLLQAVYNISDGAFHVTDLDIDYPLARENVIIFASNDAAALSEPLRDRTFEVTLRGYSRFEKRIIVKKLFDREFSKRLKKPITVDLKAINAIVQNSNEPGIREIEKVVLRIVTRAAASEKTAIEYGDVEFCLKTDHYDPTGVMINALAVNGDRGVIEPIRVTPKCCQLDHQYIGNFDESLKESIAIAKQLLACEGINISTDDVLMQMGTDSVKKSGFSAGLACFLALKAYSLGVDLNDTAVTGNLAISGGRVLPIGGICEKLLACETTGHIKRIIIPYDNLTREVSELISLLEIEEVIPVKSIYDEELANLFVKDNKKVVY